MNDQRSGVWAVCGNDAHQRPQRLPGLRSVVLALAGEEVYPRVNHHHIGLVFQDFELFDYLNILDNILHPYRINRALKIKKEVRQRAQILAEEDLHELGVTKCSTDECIVELGQAIKADKMVAGAFGLIGSTYTIDIRLIDMVTLGFEKTSFYEVRGEIDIVLSEGIAEAIRRLISQ